MLLFYIITPLSSNVSTSISHDIRICLNKNTVNESVF
jgi:hypothetical protein